jgi:hypothetical protein
LVAIVASRGPGPFAELGAFNALTMHFQKQQNLNTNDEKVQIAPLRNGYFIPDSNANLRKGC